MSVLNKSLAISQVKANQANLQAKRHLPERIFHAVSFEALALVICAPTAAWLLDKPVFAMGVLAVLLSTTAMVWNVVYNSIFDFFWPMQRVPRSWPLRIGHALGFEGGFILFGLPIAAGWLQISLLDAFLLEIGFFLFFLPYTMLYNWLYDSLRQRWLSRR
ncbi:multidrug/biocide efflux PACE transporter [Rahnella sp. SAP-1]|uniref:Multidrug/biocide efflux PACE transporter n=1 Tax=Rouxiella aceris TaxID=2703884 RepID=A0A848MPS3_9GAMM|nr:multidrug/biocide efflux PACE transporter [Rouxiella aceris]